MPFVAFDTTELLSEGICADSVLFLSPYFLISVLRVCQSWTRSTLVISLTSVLKWSIGSLPREYLVLLKYSQAPFSCANLLAVSYTHLTLPTKRIV